MSDTLRAILWSILSIGMLILAVAFFWVFLIVLAVIIVLRVLYLKLFPQKAQPGIKFYTFSTKKAHPDYSDPFHKNENTASESEYTTVIDADDMDKEYKVPKL